MRSIASEDTDSDATRRENTVAYQDARDWIDRRLILRKPLLDFEPGMECVVMCVVDFGEGPLLWIMTDDKYHTEVGQLELSCVSDYFQQQQTETLNQTGREFSFFHS